jgi:sugar lactone lactonase YvrE
MALSSNPSVIWNFPAELGEGPVWDDQNELLYWLDIKGCQLLTLDTKSGQKNIIGLSTQVSALALKSRGGLIAATKNGFANLDPQTGKLAFIVDPEEHLSMNRFNDGKCDRAGNFLAGTMDELEKQPLGTLFQLSAGGGVTPLFGGYTVCNGPAFSPDGRTLYFSNSVAREILKFDYNPNAETAVNPTVFARIPDTLGFPDGLTVDAEGCIWCAHWDGWQLTRFSQDGEIDRMVRFPVPLVTSCTFGGAYLDTMFVTTARTGLSKEILSKTPLSGSLFAFKPGVLGLPADRFAG